MASRDKTALLSLQHYFFFWSDLLAEKKLSGDGKMHERHLWWWDGGSEIKFSSLISQGVYGILSHVLYIFSVYFYFVSAAPPQPFTYFRYFVLFSLCLLRFPRGQTLASKICYIDLMFLGVLVLSLTDETLGDITTLSTAFPKPRQAQLYVSYWFLFLSLPEFNLHQRRLLRRSSSLSKHDE